MKHYPLKTSLYFCLFFAAAAFSQAPSDSTIDKLPSSRTAVIRSIILPGWGQWTNGVKWKAALVLGGELALFSVAVVQHQRAQDALGRFRAAGDYLSQSELEFYRNERSRFIWIAGAVWLLNVIDAYVDAQLKHFDISPELTWTDQPGPGVGLALSYSW